MSIALGIFVVVLSVGLACTALLLYHPYPLVSAVARLWPDVVWTGPSAGSYVALTLDDGPVPGETERALAILKTADVHATFFLIGERAAANPELVTQIRDAGHEIANHFWRDEGIVTQSPEEVIASIARTESELQQTGVPRLLRPPGGRFPRWLVPWASANGYRIVMGSIFPQDPWGTPPWFLRWAICRLARPGAIIVLHDGAPGRSRALEALPDILRCIRAKGLSPVTLRTLLAERQVQ